MKQSSGVRDQSVSPQKAGSLSRSSASWLVRNLVVPVWAMRDHPKLFSYQREFEKTQYLSLDALHALQLRRLQSLTRYAQQNCPFYRDRLQAHGLNRGDLHALEDFARWPILTKRDIQQHGAEMVSQQFPQKQRVRNQTGGSTGSPLQFYVDRDRFDSRKASTFRHNAWAGIQPGDWLASLWGSRLDQGQPQTFFGHLKNALLYRVVALNTSRITEDGWKEFISQVRKHRPVGLVAYTQSAVAFAKYLREKGIEDVGFGSIITTAEMLLPGQREFLESALHGQVFNRYGCREVSVIASECEFHRGMHVNAEALLVEIVPDGKRRGRSGRIVITDLLNYSMPLIRYEIGDVGEWAEDQNCPCGRSLPVLADVQGRITDFLELADGRRVSGPALTLVVSDMADVAQVQFVQRGPRLIAIRVVPGRDYGEGTENELRKRIGLYIGNTADLVIERTQSIASEISGKYRFVVKEQSGPSDEVTTAVSSSTNTL
jgi:phenylacetate-CoA ligase